MTPPDERIPILLNEDHRGHTCLQVRHIEDVAAEVDELRRELRSAERHHAEDLRKLWFRIGSIMAVIAAALPAEIQLKVFFP